MATITKRFDLFDIYIEPKRRVITVRQRWQYNWLVAQGLDGWTYFEKKEYHNAVDSIIWQQWSGNYYAESRISTFEKKSATTSLNQYDRQKFKINFDIEWVTSNPHWTANVKKTLPNITYDSKVNHNSNEVFLSHIDVNNSIIDSDINLNFNTVSHEFGHTINASDEYGIKYMSKKAINYFKNHPSKTFSRFQYDKDYKSRMNIGNELRDRFINTIDDCLDNMINGIEFTALLTKDYVNSIGGRS